MGQAIVVANLGFLLIMSRKLKLRGVDEEVRCGGSGGESRSNDGGEEEDEVVYKHRRPLVPGGATTQY
jgi:hypothetical protein